jgi:hypothetical protein
VGDDVQLPPLTDRCPNGAGRHRMGALPLWGLPLQTDQPSDKLRDALAVVEGRNSGAAPDAQSRSRVAPAFETLIEHCDAKGLLDNKAEASAMLATVLRIGADLAHEDRRRASLRAAHDHALKTCEHAVEAATKGSVNKANLAAYIRALEEAAQTALALGEADASAEGTSLLADAANRFGEAAAGHRRLGRDGEARLAEIKALEARSKRALRM